MAFSRHRLTILTIGKICYSSLHMKNTWFIVTVFTVALFGGAFFLAGQSSEKNNEGIVVGPHIIGGSATSTVTLVEYSDFQCPACAAFQPAVKQLLDEYGDQLSFEYRHFPLVSIHPHALKAATAAEAAGQQDKFFEFHDLLFENQSEWSRAAVPQSFYIKYAEEVGLDIELFRQHLKSSLLRDQVLDSERDAQSKGLTGTPSFFLNGTMMQYETFEDFFGQIVFAIDPSLMGTSTDSSAAPEVKFGI